MLMTKERISGGVTSGRYLFGASAVVKGAAGLPAASTAEASAAARNVVALDWAKPGRILRKSTSCASSRKRKTLESTLKTVDVAASDKACVAPVAAFCSRSLVAFPLLGISGSSNSTSSTSASMSRANPTICGAVKSGRNVSTCSAASGAIPSFGFPINTPSL
eukprot:scaffold63_cov306-Pinguiococcus_pyrenoidosus.AAC.48